MKLNDQATFLVGLAGQSEETKMSEPEWSLPMNRTELIAHAEALAAELASSQANSGERLVELGAALGRIRALEALLVDRPWPDCAQSKMIEWYKRIDAALGVSMMTPGSEAATAAYIIRLPKK